MISTLLLALALLPLAVPAQDFSNTPPTPPLTRARAEANAALEARDYPRALKLLAPLAEASPKDAQLLYDLGSVQDQLDQATAAEASYRAAIADNAAMLEPRVALGLLLARNGNRGNARAELLLAANATTGDPALRARAYRTMARIDQMARPGDARDELLEALKLSPETPEDTLLTAELAAAASNGSGAAEAAYRRVLLANANDPEATAGLAQLLIAEGHTAEAELFLLKALAAHPADPGLSVQLAKTYAAEGKPAAAVPVIEALSREHPTDVNITRLLAGLYVDAGDWAKADPLLAAVNTQNPNDTRSITDRGRVLIHLQKYAESQSLLTRIVAQPALFASKEDMADAAGYLAFAASENNDPAAALRAVQLRATVLPNSAGYLFVAAISYDRLHQTRAAIQAYKAFLAASKGANADQDFEATHRLIALEHSK